MVPVRSLRQVSYASPSLGARHGLTQPEYPLRTRGELLRLSARREPARSVVQVNRKGLCSMRTIVKLLIALAFGAALAGCVVAPVGPPRAYVGVVAPAPVVIYHRW